MVFLLCFPDAVQNEVGRLDMPRTSGGTSVGRERVRECCTVLYKIHKMTKVVACVNATVEW